MRIQSTFLVLVRVLLFLSYTVSQESIYILDDNIYGDIGGVFGTSRSISI